jgi:hypothetical protein
MRTLFKCPGDFIKNLSIKDTAGCLLIRVCKVIVPVPLSGKDSGLRLVVSVIPQVSSFYRLLYDKVAFSQVVRGIEAFVVIILNND